MNATLRGQRGWVFGGTSGIGLASARALAELGAEIAVAGSSQSNLDAALKTLPDGARGFAVGRRGIGGSLDRFRPVRSSGGLRRRRQRDRHAMIGPLALELAPIRVNAVSPGFIDTPYWRKAMPEQAREKLYAEMAAAVPVKRVGTPEEVGQAVAMVALNTFITGAIVDCDGGRRLGG